MTNFKILFKENSLIRGLVRSYRSVFGQPIWGNIVTNIDKRRFQNNTGSNILFCTGGGAYTSGTHIESMLSVAMQQRGYKSHVLLCDEVLPGCLQCTIDWDRDEKKFAKNGPPKMHCKTCYSSAAKMYESIGCEVHTIGSLVQREERDQIKNLVDGLSEDVIKQYTYDDIPVGEHAYAGTLRFYAKAELSDPYSKEILRRYLAASIISTLAIKRLCAKINFYRAVLHHGIYVPQGLFAESLIRLGIPIVTWHVAYRKETFVFSHGGTYHHTLMTEPVSEWENIEWSDHLNNEIIDYLNSRWFGTKDWIHFHRNTVFDKEKIYSEIGVRRDKPYVLALTNVMWDAQLHYPNNAFSGMLEWLKYTIKWFVENPEIQLIIRVHPAEVNGTLPSRQLVTQEIENEFGKLPDNIFIIGPNNPMSTYVIAEDCNAVIIYGTKTGVELAAKGIPVIVAGEAWIRNKGVTIDVSSPEEYKTILQTLPFKSRMNMEQQNRALKYAYHFFFRRMIPLPFLKADNKSVKPFEFQIKSVSDLDSGVHSGLDIICDGILKQTPFIYPAENDVLS